VSSTTRYFFKRADKLKSRKAIEQLFREGKSFSNFPFKVTWLSDPTATASLQAGVGVSSRHFKKAVDRNRIKRLMREAYRLQKHELQQQVKSSDVALTLFLIYTGKELPGYQLVYEKTGIVLSRLQKFIHENDPLPS